VRYVSPSIPVYCRAELACPDPATPVAGVRQLAQFARDPQHRALALFNIGIVLESANQWANARTFYTKALEETPGRRALSRGPATSVSALPAHVLALLPFGVQLHAA
jgi:hypothetical protein